MRYKKSAMIVAPQPEPTEAGADILREGGNAVDAGIACALVQGVVDPQMCGIAGFGSCGIYMPGKKFHGYIDAHAPAPLAARPDMWANLIESEARDGYGFILRGRVNDIGYRAICAPANLKMYYEAHRLHGSLPWSRIVEPAIHWAENGWTVRPHVHFWWADDGAFGRAPNYERTGFTPAARALYCRPDGTPNPGHFGANSAAPLLTESNVLSVVACKLAARSVRSCFCAEVFKKSLSIDLL